MKGKEEETQKSVRKEGAMRKNQGSEKHLWKGHTFCRDRKSNCSVQQGKTLGQLRQLKPLFKKLLVQEMTDVFIFRTFSGGRSKDQKVTQFLY